ncbi:MAG: LbtU family siderophore porin [Pseudomonadota bacterium]
MKYLISLFGFAVLSPIAFAEVGLEGRIIELENKLSTFEQSTAEQVTEEEPTKPTFNALIEFEAGWNKSYDDITSSDFAVATVELLMAHQLNDYVSAEVGLLYEEGETPIEVDIALLRLAAPESPFYIAAGQFYQSFGSFESGMISDPLTLELGETRETSLVGGFENEMAFASFYVFNGNQQTNLSDETTDYGVNIGVARETEDSSFSVQAGYISNLAESDGLESAILAGSLSDEVAGFAISSMTSFQSLSLILEWISAEEAFEATAFEFDGAGAKPQAWNVEVGHNFNLMNKGALVSLGYQGTEEALALELPKERILAALKLDIFEKTLLGFEISMDQDYSEAVGGTDENAATFITQLAVEI